MREREKTEAKDTHSQSHKLLGKRKKRVGEREMLERVELMDNVSPLWCWQAGRRHL